MSITPNAPWQDAGAEHDPLDLSELPPGFDARRWPIIAVHHFGVPPEITLRAPAKTRAKLRLVSNRTVSPLNDELIDVEQFTRAAYEQAAAVDKQYHTSYTLEWKMAALGWWLCSQGHLERSRT